MEPVVKWAGGKRQLLKELRAHMPAEYHQYVEPFAGSAALYLDVQPEVGILNDMNGELINLYRQVRDDPVGLQMELDSLMNAHNSLADLDEKKDFYLQRRKEYNANINGYEYGTRDAALMVYLNKACFNGLYRTNRSGRYNVPFGKRETVNLYRAENVQACSALLQRTTLLHEDFEEVCRCLDAGDFVYFDSPYYDTFDTYQPGGFPEAEHRRVAKVFRELTDRGVKCLLSNSDTYFIKELYQDFKQQVVTVNRAINRDGKGRKGTELLVWNYDIPGLEENIAQSEAEA